jgi:hypothetical protein
MSQETKPAERVISLGGKTYPVRISLGLLTKAQAKAQSNLMLPATWRPMNPADLQAVLWAVLGANENGELSYDRLGERLVPSMELYEIHSVFLGAWSDGFAQIDEEPEAPFTSPSEGGGLEPASTSDSAVLSTKT